MLINIQWCEDTYECEDCGTSYASGAVVTLNDETILNLIPSAHCFGGTHYETEEVYRQIFDKLGYTLKETY